MLHRDILSNPPRDAVLGVRSSAAPQGLRAITEPGCAAAIWHRAPLQAFQDWIDSLRPDELPRTRVILRPDVVRGAMTDLVDSVGLNPCPERTMLVDDVAALASMFSTVMQVPYLRLRLDVVSTNACRKFHIDAVTARLLCTYRGSGTQYGIAAPGQEPKTVHALPTGSAMILRGTNWPDAPAPNLLHRSPPIEGTGETRLVLVLDPIVDLEGEIDPVTTVH